MFSAIGRAWGIACAIVSLGCSSVLPSAPPLSGPAVAADPTPLRKCRVTASSANPLVTEWPASEKAHLQSMAGSQTVAVEYAGCDLSIVDGCVLPGGYTWQRTTLATDTIEISNADDLFAKLPIGAVGLEAELKRSGRLAVRTTVAGQLRAAAGSPASQDPACSRATHYVAAISVGSFQLVSGADISGSTGADVYTFKTGGHASKKQEVLREAGTREGCLEATDAAPPVQCASPIQVFLVPLASRGAPAPRSYTSYEDAQRATGVAIAFPPPKDRDETWTVRAPGGRIVCQVPCQAWVGPVSGYYMQREPRGDVSQAVLHLPQAFPHPVGSHVTAEYQALRGNPSLSRWAFYLAVPMGVMGAGLTAWGIVQATKSCPDRPDGECFPDSGFLLTSGILWLAAAGAATWWYFWSHDEKFTTYEDLGASRSAAWASQPLLWRF